MAVKHKKPRGRALKNPPGSLRPILYDSVTAIKLPGELKSLLVKEARRKRRSVSWILRDLIAQRFHYHEADPDDLALTQPQ